MTPEEVEALVERELEKRLPEMLGRSMVQVREYLIENIT